MKLGKDRTNLGILLGLVSAVAYGTNPLFGVPLIRVGFQVDSMLLFRFLLGGFVVFLIACFRKSNFKVGVRQCAALATLGFLFAFSAEALFQSFKLMSASVASTLLFLYPIFTASIMWAFFGERLNKFLFLALVLSLTGVILLFKDEGNAGVSLLGIAIVVLSALTYSLYIICIKKTSVCNMDGLVLTFYALTFAGIFTLLKSLACGTFQLPSNAFELYNTLALAFVPTALAIASIAYSIKYSGATIAAILGAFEPITAVSIGVLFLGEPFTLQFALAIVLILASAFLIVAGSRRNS